MKGSCPVRISRIKPDGAAYRRGLHRGDYIVKTNGQNISRSSAESVARIVRHSSKHLELTVYCPHKQPTKTALQTSLDVSQGRELGKTLTEEPDGCSRLSSYEEDGEDEDNVHEDVPQEHKINSALWDPDISIIPVDDTAASQLMDSQLVQPNNSPVSHLADSESCNLSCDDTCQDIHKGALREYKLNFARWDPDVSIIPVDATADSRFVDDLLASQLAHNESSSLSIDVSRQVAIVALLEGEEKFVGLMQQGMQCYSRPLKHAMLSSRQHFQLFQNIEKVSSVHWFIDFSAV